jgi:hypothetical protein
LGAAAAAALVTAAACGDSTGLPPATIDNVVDTATLFALNGTPVGTPSAFDVAAGVVTRLELGNQFDLAVDLDSAGAAVLYPASLLGGRPTAGIQHSSETFEEITRAPLDDYVVDSITTVAEDSTFLVRSRATGSLCNVFVGSVPRYGKFHVLAIDTVARTITFEFMVNVNCGYRDLTPGLPTS